MSKNNKFSYSKALKDNTSSTGKNPFKYIDIYLNRPIASLIVRAVFNTSITPNMITLFSGIIGLIGAFFFTRGEYSYFVFGGIFAQLSSIIDGADGMLARAKNLTSSWGSYLDLIFDRIVDYALFISISIGGAKYYNNSDLLFLGSLGAGLVLLQINILYLTRSYQQKKETGETGEMRALQMWGILILACLNRVDLIIYLGLMTTAILNITHFTHFIRLNIKKNELLSRSSDKTNKSKTSQQQSNKSSDQNQS